MPIPPNIQEKASADWLAIQGKGELGRRLELSSRHFIDHITDTKTKDQKQAARREATP